MQVKTVLQPFSIKDLGTQSLKAASASLPLQMALCALDDESRAGCCQHRYASRACPNLQPEGLLGTQVCQVAEGVQ